MFVDFTIYNRTLRLVRIITGTSAIYRIQTAWEYHCQHLQTNLWQFFNDVNLNMDVTIIYTWIKATTIAKMATLSMLFFTYSINASLQPLLVPCSNEHTLLTSFIPQHEPGNCPAGKTPCQSLLLSTPQQVSYCTNTMSFILSEYFKNTFFRLDITNSLQNLFAYLGFK